MTNICKYLDNIKTNDDDFILKMLNITAHCSIQSTCSLTLAKGPIS